MKQIFLVITLVLVLGLVGYFMKAGVDRSVSKDSIEKTVETTNITPMGATGGNYVNYSEVGFIENKAKKRVLFFHAAWCPTCKVANEEFVTRQTQIPEDVVVFKVDYDTESELKRKYAITYQHTFVLVDDQGNEIKKWNGGEMDELISNTQS